MARTELNDFYNNGYGWICKPCEREIKERKKQTEPKTSRLMREGEAESKHLQLSSIALAKWADNFQQILMCPRCGITEPIDKI